MTSTEKRPEQLLEPHHRQASIPWPFQATTSWWQLLLTAAAWLHRAGARSSR